MYATDAASVADDVEIIAEVPADALKTPVYYPVGLTVDSEASDSEKAAAEAFLEYLQTDDSMEVFEKYGFAPIETANDAADSEETEVEETTETPEATEEAE